MRWVFLATSCSRNLGNYFCQDIPGALEVNIESTFGINEVQFNTLYTASELPSIIFPLLGGFFIDKLGVRAGAILFASLVLCGQGVFTLGGYTETFWLMIVGRLLFGIASTSLCVVQAALLSHWFLGKELSFATGIYIGVIRFGNSVNTFMTPRLFQSTQSLGVAITLGFGICVLSLITTFITCSLDRKNDRLKVPTTQAHVDEKSHVSLKDIKKFTLSFWILVALCLTLYSCLNPFFNIANKFVQVRFGFEQVDAGSMLVVFFLSTGVLTPAMGYLTDKIGKRLYIFVFAIIVAVIAQLLLGLIPISREANYLIILPLALLALFYAVLVSVLWSSIAMVTEKKNYGLAFGLTYSFRAIGLTLVPLLIGWLQTMGSDGYTYISLLFVGFSAISMALVIWLGIVDKKNGGVLQKPPTEHTKAIESIPKEVAVPNSPRDEESQPLEEDVKRK